MFTLKRDGAKHFQRLKNKRIENETTDEIALKIILFLLKKYLKLRILSCNNLLNKVKKLLNFTE